jgi:hypothetical protein
LRNTSQPIFLQGPTQGSAITDSKNVNYGIIITNSKKVNDGIINSISKLAN